MTTNKPDVQGEAEAITDADILAIAGRVESCPVSPWWLKDDVAVGDVRAAVLRFARALLVAASQPAEQHPADSADVRLDKQCRQDVADALGFPCGGNYAWSYLLQQIKDAVSVAEQQPDVAGLVEALEVLVSETESNTCPHDNTYRGGAIWEVCEDCGTKWADDRGGKPDVTQLVEALVACAKASSAAEVGLIVDAALYAYRKGGSND